jgi:hypothetical protein
MTTTGDYWVTTDKHGAPMASYRRGSRARSAREAAGRIHAASDHWHDSRSRTGGHSDRVPKGRHDDRDLVARDRREFMQHVAARPNVVIRVDAVWLVVEPLDMRTGADTALAWVIRAFGETKPYHA